MKYAERLMDRQIYRHTSVRSSPHFIYVVQTTHNNDAGKCKLFLLCLFTDTFLSSDPPGERVFRAMFRVVRGDSFSPELADPATEGFRVRARDYRERLNLVFRRSDLRSAFLGTEVLALDG
jgi:hypothetical protein